MLFNNYLKNTGGDVGNAILYIGDKCPTNCYNCTRNLNIEEYYSYSSFFDVINFINKNCDKGVNVFLKGVEAIFHPDIEQFLTDKLIAGFSLGLHVSPIYSTQAVDKILYLSNKYKELSFDTTYTIKSKQELTKVLQFIKFTTTQNIDSTLDLFMDYENFLYNFIRVLKILGFKYSIKESSSHFINVKCYEFFFNNRRQNILVYDGKKQEIANNEITNLGFDYCVAKSNFMVEDKKILIREEIEFNYNGDIKIHLNSYCSKGIQKISSIYSDSIVDDFEKFDEHLQKYENDYSMGKNCYTCIQNPYNIDNTN